MSDGTSKPDEENSTDGGIKRAGRARICKQCKFTTTDVREFSQHRQHAHAEENSEENKAGTRKNSLKRKSSAADKGSISTVRDEQKVNEIKPTAESDTKSEHSAENKEDLNSSLEDKNKMDTSDNTENKIMASEQISNEYLNTLALAPRKQVSDSKKGQSSDDLNTKRTNERTTIEHVNGHSEEVVLDNRDDEQDDEHRLYIAEDSENGDMDLNASDGHPPSRSGNIQNRTYLCSNCDFSATSAKAYLRHQKDVHNSGILIYECDICDYATKYKQKLPRHRKLHFLGRDGLAESDLDSSLTERELKELRDNNSTPDHINGDDDLDDDGDLEEDDDEEMVTLASTPVMGATPGAPPEKKKRIRQEVDPLKYYEVVDDIGVKYACSKCGNVYKWRKSLNKHWKEKHFGETPDLTKPPATLQNYTLYSRYKAKYGGAPPPPAAPNVVYGAAAASPANQVKNRSTPTSKTEDNELPSTPSLSSVVVMPRQIGPFIGGTNQGSQLFAMTSHLAAMARTPESHHDVRQIMESQQQARLLELAQQLPKQIKSQDEPLDFSKKSDSSVKSEPSWGDTNSESDSLSEMPMSVIAQANSQIAAAFKSDANHDQDPTVLKCTKCNFTAKTLVDYSAHMSIHLNKRAFKCAECQAHFTAIEELNSHFSECHSEKIQEHKEAIQKIPHGLQQTYHLLKMPLDSISGLSSQELLSNEPKQLKCSMCNFVAKWPAELQKHAVSHSEERPFVCMVCGSTYKWKWDLVKHFEKSHGTLPNPYKRREGGGVMAVASSPSTPPLDTMAKSASAMMDVAIMGANYVMEEDVPPTKKRRLSENEVQDTDDYYRELLERQVRARREMAGLETPPHLKLYSRLPYSDPTLKSGRDHHMQDDIENHTPKRNVHEALKQRLNSGKPMEEEATPLKDAAGNKGVKGSDVLLPYKCSVCEYRARWPSEISQHMKNHSNEKPFHCPRCSYKSKWKWDVVKHLRRCGGGTVHDVIDTTKLKKMAAPNVTVMPTSQSSPQQQQQQTAQPPPLLPKPSPNQVVFPGNKQNSVSSALPASASMKTLAANFSMASGGQQHPESMDTSERPKQQALYRSIVNQGMHYCLECPFVGSSPTELRRHSMLHSDSKPFGCLTCGYTTRWKCDLKKHMKTYGHFQTNTNLDSGDDDMENSNEQSYVDLAEDSDDDNKSTLYMCPQCPYNSYKKNAYELHLRIHGSMMDESAKGDGSSNESSAKYRCSKCDFRGNDLSAFLSHKRTHHEADHIYNGDSVVLGENSNVADVSNRTIHLKQRRKPVKQFKCGLCPYICFKKSSLDVHDAMHIPRGSDTFLCMFCDYNVFSKSLLLQHMRLHPEYNPAECSEADGMVTAAELMEMEELEEREINSDETRSMSGPEENNNVDAYQNSDNAVDFTKAPAPERRTPTPTNVRKDGKTPSPTNNNNNNIVKNNNEKISNTSGMNLPCEWCSATFPNLVALYQHSQSLHPTQLKAQEAGEIAASQAPSKTSQLEQIVRDRQREYQVYHQIMARQQPQIQLQIQTQIQSQAQSTQDLMRKYPPLAPKTVPQPTATLTRTSASGQYDDGNQDGLSVSPSQLSPTQLAQLRARKSVSQQKKARSFQCTKCTFTAPNAVTYLRHIERHGSNCKHTCLYCDYSIDRLNLLYQHMKGTHGTKWQGTTEEKISLSIHSEDSNNNIIENGAEDGGEEVNADNYKQTVETVTSRESNFTMQRTSVLNDDYPSEIYDKMEGGNNLKLQEAKGMLSCPKCPYKTTEKAKLQIHLERHAGSLSGRFECQLCDYSVDQYEQLRQHARLHSTKFLSPGQNSGVDETLGNESTYEDQEFAKRWTANNFTEKDKKEDKLCFKCGACPYFTTKKAAILKHRLNHINKSPFACQKCSFSTSVTSELEQHVHVHGDVQVPVNHLEFIVDPFSEMYKVIESFPDDTDMGEEENVKMVTDEARMENEMEIDDVEDDIEAAMMEEELRDTINGNENLDNSLEKDTCFDADLQFRTYKCAECPYSSNSNAEYTKHLRLHGADKKFICDYCSYSLDRVNLISQHRKLHFQEKDFESAPKVAKLLNKSHEEYEAMLAKVGNEIAYPPVEAMPKVGEDQLELYLSQKSGDDKNRYACNKCPYKCQALKSFRCHITMHGINRKYKCDYCDWSTDRLNLLIQHRRVHAGEKGFDSAPGEIVFLNREYVLDGETTTDGVVGTALMDYQETAFDLSKSPRKNANGERIYFCKQCPFQSVNLNTYSYHKKLHCIQAKYSCTECSYSINNLISLKEHTNLHQKERELIKASLTEGGVKHKCPKCPYSSSNKNLLVNHTSMHGSGRKHECNQCDFSSDTQAILQQHQKVHEDGYTDTDSLEELELLMKRRTDVIGPQLYLSTSNVQDMDSDSSDTNDPDHKCDKCPFSTPSKDELGSHSEHHQVRDKNMCMYCTFSCTKEDELITHVQVHFPSTTVDKDLVKLLKRQSHKRNISKSFNEAGDKIESNENGPGLKDGEPDSTTISEPSKGEVNSEGKQPIKPTDVPKEVEKTKVYVCQYCEREFDEKTSMIQHEKQHLVGSKFYT